MKVKLMMATVLISLTATVNNPVFAQTPRSNSKPAITNSNDVAKTETVKKLLEITGSRNLYEQMLTQMINSLKAQYPEAPAKYWNTFTSEINTDNLFKELIPFLLKRSD